MNRYIAGFIIERILVDYRCLLYSFLCRKLAPVLSLTACSHSRYRLGLPQVYEVAPEVYKE